MKKYYIPADLNPNASLKEIAHKYKVSLSTASRWRRAVRAGEIEKIQRHIPLNSRILGILWAIGSDNGDFFYLRSRHREIIEEVKNYFGITSAIIEGSSNTGVQYKLKIFGWVRTHILNELQKRGWTPRNADIREYPVGDIDHREFIRAWMQLHSYYYARKHQLRIYGNQYLITTMSDIISRLTGIAPKKPYQLHNRKTYEVRFYNKEVDKIFNYFDLVKEW